MTTSSTPAGGDDRHDESRCPICGGPNHCGALRGCTDGAEPCWCTTIAIPAGLRALVPDAQRMKACICIECIRAGRGDESPDR